MTWTWEVTAAFGLAVVATGLLAGPALGPQGSGAGNQRAGMHYGWGIATLALGWVVLMLAIAIFLSERQIGASESAAREGQLADAADAARSGIALRPWAAEPRLQLALVQEEAGDLDAAAETAEEARDRAANDWQVWLVRARIATTQGNIDEAEANLEEARRLNSRAPIFISPKGSFDEPAPGSGG